MAKRVALIVAAILIAIPSVASAKPRHHHHRHIASAVQAEIVCDMQGCRASHENAYGRLSDGRHVARTGGGVVPHPEGCPWRAFCGCGASIRVFGRSIRSLWPAAAWFKFPRTSPAPGMAAVRKHHVMVLESHVSDDVWTVYDANSGGHRTRIHERSIAGYVIVNPHGNKVAGL